MSEEHEIEIDNETWEYFQKHFGVDDPRPQMLVLLEAKIAELRAAEPDEGDEPHDF